MSPRGLERKPAEAGDPVLRALSLLVPRAERAAWLAEWNAELEHLRAAAGGGRAGRRSGRYMSAGEDALRMWVRRLSIPVCAQDVRFALRTLRKSPGYTVVAVMTFTLGIGANAGIFSVLNAYVLRPLSLADAGRVMVILGMKEGRIAGVSAPDYLDWRERSASFESVAAMHRFGVTLTGVDAPVRLRHARVTPSFLEVAGVEPLLGRGFTDDEAVPGNDRVTVLSYDLWQTAFGADPEVVGRTVMLDGERHTVVGVMPASFRFPPMGDVIWRPLAFDQDAIDHRGRHNLWVFGRLADGVSEEEAAAEMGVLAQSLEEAYPDTNKGQGARVMSLHRFALDGSTHGLLILFAAAGFVLLIACANLANLTLARGAAREREMMVRTALGASGARIVSQLLTESLVLAAAGGTLGLALAYGSLGLIESLVPEALGRLGPLRVDGGVLLFALAASTATGLGSGLVPGLRIARSATATASGAGLGWLLKARGTAGRVRNAMVVAEFALAVVLLTGAGLLMRSIERLYAADLGLDTSKAVTFGLVFPRSDYPEPADVTLAVSSVLENLAAERAVGSVAGVSQLPLTGRGLSSGLLIDGGPPEINADSPNGNLRMVTPGYFELLGIKVVMGRTLTDEDDDRAPPVVILNRSAAAAYWGAENPIGKWVAFNYLNDQPLRRRVVGVIADVRQAGPAGAVFPEVYIPHRQAGEVWNWNGAAMSFVLEPAAGGVVSLGSLRGAVEAVDPDLPVNSVRTLDSMMGFTVAEARFNGILLGGFSGLALLLAVVGIYGVMSFSVRKRTREIGVHVAIGAARREIMGRIVLDGAKLAATGTVVGVGGALLLTRLMSSMLFEVSTSDPATYGGVVVILGAATLGACLVPAWRASKIDPMEALRAE